MPNAYKGAGNPPVVCLDSPVPPVLGDGPSGGSPTTRVNNAMVAASNPFQMCCSDACCSPPPPCCGSGGDGGGLGDGIPGRGFLDM
jgi:hypothetical protein